MILLFRFVVPLLGLLGAASSANGETAATSAADEDFELPPMPTLPEVGVCQTYSGKLCEDYLKDRYVFVAPNKTVQDVETEISTVFNIFRQSKDMASNCRKYALISMCYIKFPTCRQPDLLNAQYFGQLAKIIHLNFRNKHFAQGSRNLGTTKPSELNQKELFKRDNFNMICREDCLVLENLLCEKEFAIGKRHPIIGELFLNFKSCNDLLGDQQTTVNNTGAEEEPERRPKEGVLHLPHGVQGTCLSIGVNKTDSDGEGGELGNTCFWGDGKSYKGTVNRTITGRICEYWTKSPFKDIPHNPELIGNNYCRNPNSLMDTPWCYSRHEKEATFIIELCAVDSCLTRVYFFSLLSVLLLATTILIALFLYKIFRSRSRKIKSPMNIPLSLRDPMCKRDEMQFNRFNDMATQLNTYKTPKEAEKFCAPKEILMNDNLSAVGGGGGEGRPEKGNNVPIYDLNGIQFLEILGEGTFGQVYKGDVCLRLGQERTVVAIKTLKETATDKQRKDFKHEIDLISDLNHKNIVNILGIVMRNNFPILMLFEYMRNGDLHEYLLKMRTNPDVDGELTPNEFLTIFMEISSGMEYLSSHHYVHRDLAARNCLVADDNYSIKISDFGLSRDIYSSDYYRVKSKTLLPIRWMPSEAILYGKFTTESDIWSFGVCMWEIYSYGEQPYRGITNPEVINMVRKRQLLPCPPNCPSQVYSLMVECWHEQSVRRPKFSEIYIRLRAIQNQMKKTELYGSQNGSMFSIATNSTNNVSICGSRSLSANQTDLELAEDQFSVDSRCHDGGGAAGCANKGTTGSHRSHRSNRHPKPKPHSHSNRQRNKHEHPTSSSSNHRSSRNSHKIQNTMILP